MIFLIRGIERGPFGGGEEGSSEVESGQRRKIIEFGAAMAVGAAIGRVAVDIMAEAISLAGRQLEEVPKGAAKSIE